jgi:LAO/AO transport system kinase
MQALGLDPGVFIRSMATRGNLGGLARATVDAVAILDAAGFEKVIVETVGVGQDEVEIVKTADVSVVVLVPGMGDDIQAIKAGIMEIGDVFVINKADRDGVLRTEKELEALLSLAHRPDMWMPPIVKTVATENKGSKSWRRPSKVTETFSARRRTRRSARRGRALAHTRTAARASARARSRRGWDARASRSARGRSRREATRPLLGGRRVARRGGAIDSLD